MVWFLAFVLLISFFLGLYVYNQRIVKKDEAKFPPIGDFVTVEGTKLHYISRGKGKPVVFLHGGILSVHDYMEVVELTSKKYHAIALDRPGYGYSERPAMKKVTPIVQAQMLRKAFRKLNIEKPILVGHSMSGLVVVAYAIQYPDELSGIVLLAPAVYGGKAYPAGTADLILGKLVRIPILGKLLVSTLLAPLMRKVAKFMVNGAFSPDLVPEEYLEMAVALSSRPSQIIANREDVLFFSPTANQLCERYKEIQIPTVIVVGEHDPFRPELQAYAFHQMVPRSKLIVLEDVGHMIPQLKPTAVFEAIQICERSGKDDFS